MSLDPHSLPEPLRQQVFDNFIEGFSMDIIVAFTLGRAFRALEAAKPNAARRPFHSNPSDPDFWSHGNRLILTELGIFSIDQPAQRKLRQEIADEDARIDAAYRRLGIDRQAIYADIEARLDGKRFDGIWARSTGEFARAKRAYDRAVLDQLAGDEAGRALGLCT